MPRITRRLSIERIGVREIVGVQVQIAKHGVEKRFFEQVGVARVAIGQIHIVLEEYLATAGA